MDAALVGQVAVVLGSIGAALQWLRQFTWFKEGFYYGVTALLSAVALLFVGGFPSGQAAVMLFIVNWPLFLTFQGSLMAGTKVASDTAKAGVKVAPMTNSKP